MDGQVIFKSSVFGGFDKREVVSYIDEITGKATLAEENLNKQIQDMTAAGAELYSQITKFGEQIDTLEQQLETERTTIAHLTAQMDELTDDLHIQKDRANKNEIAYKLEAERTRKLMEENKFLLEKGKKYDEAAKEVGAVLLEGTQSARMMMRDAQNQAQMLQDYTRTSAEQVTADLARFHGEMDTLKGDIVKTMTDLIDRIDALDASARGMSAHLESALGAKFVPTEAEAEKEFAFTPEQVPASPEPPKNDKVERFFRPAANI